MGAMSFFRRFRADESGAITVPWIVFCGGVFFMGISMIGPISDGASRVTAAVSNQLGGTTDKTEFK